MKPQGPLLQLVRSITTAVPNHRTKRLLTEGEDIYGHNCLQDKTVNP